MHRIYNNVKRIIYNIQQKSLHYAWNRQRNKIGENRYFRGFLLLKILSLYSCYVKVKQWHKNISKTFIFWQGLSTSGCNFVLCNDYLLLLVNDPLNILLWRVLKTFSYLLRLQYEKKIRELHKEHLRICLLCAFNKHKTK